MLRARRILVVALVTVAAVSACTGANPGPAACSAAWSDVPLPAGLVPLSMAASGSVVLVGGSSPVDAGPTPGSPSTGNPDAVAQGESGSRQPRLYRLNGTTLDGVPLAPSSPYGHLAQFVYLATDGSSIAAVGDATGGAHLNPRWTVWRGGPDGVTEQPQGMETFGGWDAGSLDGIALGPAGPLLIGSWSTGPGSIATALWTTSAAQWRRDPTAAPLAGTASRPAEPTGIATQGDAILVSGFDIGGSSAALRAGLWLGDRAGDWRRVGLPGADADSVATAIGCRAEDCWVVGRIAGDLVVWRVAAGAASRVDDVPGMTVAATGPAPVVAVSDDLVWVDVPGSDQAPAVYSGGTWRRAPSPGPEITAIAASGRELLAVTGSLPATRLAVACVG